MIIKTLLIAGFFLISGAAAAKDEWLYRGNHQVDTPEIKQAFLHEGLSGSLISSSHLRVIELLYRGKGIDFIGLVEVDEPYGFEIIEQPHWLIDENFSAFFRVNPQSLGDIMNDGLMQELGSMDKCLAVYKTGPANFSLEALVEKPSLSPEVLICPEAFGSVNKGMTHE